MTTPPPGDWDKPREFLGHAVENGRINYLSVSAVEKAAPRSMGCFRRWYFRYVLGDKEPEKDASRVAKEKGTRMHDRLAHYARTGEMILQAPEVKGLHMLPAPGPDLWVEQAFHRVSPGADAKHPVITSSLHANGIPFVGYIDLAHGRLKTWTEDDGHITDPPGTIEVIDHKFKTNAKDRGGNYTYKMPGELVQTVQMAGYGKVIANTQPNAERVRLSHLYYPEKGDKPRKVTRLHVLDDCLKTWDYVDGVARTLVDVAKETDVNRVDGNVQACDALGGCPYRDKCTKYRTTSLDALWGKVASDFTKEQTMGILTSNPQIMQNAMTSQPQPQTDMRAQLAAEEAQMKAQQVQQQAAAAPAAPQPNFIQAWMQLMAFGRGYPRLGGAAAMAYALAGGQSIAPGSEYPGFGELGHITLQDPAHVYQLVNELQAAATGATQPAMQPAQPPVQAAPAAQITTQYSTATATGGILAPGTPESQPQLAQQVVAPPAQPAEQPKKRAGRPKKNDPTPATPTSGASSEAVGTVQPTQTAATAEPPSTQLTHACTADATQVTPTSAPTSSRDTSSRDTSSRDTTSCILVNARSTTVATKSLAGYVDWLNAELAKMYCVDAAGKPSIQDVRTAPKDSPLAFGGWKGAVRECALAHPPDAGAWHLDTHLDDLNEIVADALRVICERNGWLYVRGVR